MSSHNLYVYQVILYDVARDKLNNSSGFNPVVSSVKCKLGTHILTRSFGWFLPDI